MSNEVMNAHIAYGSPCGDDAGLFEVADWAGDLLLNDNGETVTIPKDRLHQLLSKELWFDSNAIREES